MAEGSPRFVPDVGPTGGTALGNSYLSTWANCPREWFNLYYRPIIGYDENDKEVIRRGIQLPTTATPLINGRIFHEAIGEWYNSGVRDGDDTGERSVEKAIDMARTHWTRAAGMNEYGGGAEESEESWRLLEQMIRDYHNDFGPDSMEPEFPEIRVVCDDQGQPLIEREWVAPLKPGYNYTCRTDLIITYRGNLMTMEHKSATRSSARMMLNSLATASQFTGEYWILSEIFPEEVLSGVLVNVVFKGPRPKTARAQFQQAAVRESTTRSPGMIEAWKKECIHILDQIEESIGEFDKLIQEGGDPEQAMMSCFPIHGIRTGRCNAYGRNCDYYNLCMLAGMEARQLNQFRPKVWD